MHDIGISARGRDSSASDFAIGSVLPWLLCVLRLAADEADLLTFGRCFFTLYAS